MLKKTLFRLLSFTIFSILIIVSTNAKSNFNKKASDLINHLENLHYTGLQLGDEEYRSVKKTFLYRLDPYALLFSANDMEMLLNIPLSTDSFKEKKDIIFFTQTLETYQKRLEEAGVLIKKILTVPLNYRKNDNFLFYNESNISYALSEAEKEKRWKLWLKYRILTRLYNKSRENNEISSTAAELLKYEEEIRNLVLKQETLRLKGISSHPEGFKKYLSGYFFNSLTNQFDPHSTYFSSKDINFWQTLLSKESYSYGFYVTKNSLGDFEIEYLTPGSPAWRSAKLNEKDIILKVKWLDTGRFMDDLSHLNQYDANNLINTPNSNKIELTVRKKSGQISIVTLSKGRVDVAENVISNFILKGRKDVGYIYLPGFFTSWGKSGNSGCANEMAKEIMELKRENINGLILDLRNNAGGSMHEALSLAGIFINEGPLSIKGRKEKKPILVKDVNRGLIYDGPMLVLVNEHSASASEFVTAILKDYNRAVIVGRPTYGKATAQVLLPLVENFENPGKLSRKQYNSLDYFKVTTNKYYNLRGTTHQLTGIKPHIFLPGLNAQNYQLEKDFPRSLLNDSVSKEVNYIPLSPLPVKILARNSAIRVSKNSSFQKINSLVNQLSSYKKMKTSISLDIEIFIKQMNNKTELETRLEQAVTTPSKYEVGFSAQDLKIMEVNTFKKAINEEYRQKVKKDIYIEEAFHIMLDLIGMTEK